MTVEFILSVMVGVVLGSLLSQLINSVVQDARWSEEHQKKLKRAEEERGFWATISNEVRQADGNVLIWPPDKFDLVLGKMQTNQRYTMLGFDRENFVFSGKVILRGE